MPRNDMNYSKMCIYKIVCNDLNVKDLYVGFTTNITKRRAQHKSRCSNSSCKHYNNKIYEMIRANGNWENWSVVIIENIENCTNGEDARTRARYYLEQLNANLNVKRPIITDDESKENKKDCHKAYYENNREKHLEYSKEYKIKNNDKVNAYNRAYRAKKKEQNENEN